MAVIVAWPPTTLDVQAIASGSSARFAPQSLTVHPGRITVRLENLDGGAYHSIAIRGEGVNVKGRAVARGGVSVVTAQLASGKYTLYSASDGAKSGPTGTLIVR